MGAGDRAFRGSLINALHAQVEIGSLLERRRLSLLSGDIDSLERLLHEEFRYVDSLGRELDRAAYLKSRRDGEITFSRHELSSIVVRELVPGQSALVTCLVHDAATFRGQPFEARYRAVHVCVVDGGRWVFLFGQSTPIEP